MVFFLALWSKYFFNLLILKGGEGVICREEGRARAEAKITVTAEAQIAESS